MADKLTDATSWDDFYKLCCITQTRGRTHGKDLEPYMEGMQRVCQLLTEMFPSLPCCQQSGNMLQRVNEFVARAIAKGIPDDPDTLEFVGYACFLMSKIHRGQIAAREIK